MMKLRTRGSLAVAGAALALGLSLTGCSALNSIIGGGNDAPRDDDTGEVTEDADIDIFSLKVGDCLPSDASTSGETSTTSVVPCDEPHSDEVYYEFDLPDGDFPDSDTIDAAVNDTCIPQFETFIGSTWDTSSLEITYYAPTEDSWNSLNDRKIQCLVYDPAGDTTGTLAGSAK